MATEKRLIDANALMKDLKEEHDNIMQDPEVKSSVKWREAVVFHSVSQTVRHAPTVDAVEIDVLEDWLYEIANNNFGNSLCQSCLEIANRLGGLRVFARERKDNG